MEIISSTIVVTALFLTGSASGEFGQPEPESAITVAEFVYTYGKIYTINKAQLWAEAVAIKDGKFIVAGTNEEVATVTNDDTEVIDLKGGFPMPGIHDTHVRPPLVYTNKEVGELLFPESTPIDEITKIVTDCAEKYPSLKITRGQKSATGPQYIRPPAKISESVTEGALCT